MAILQQILDYSVSMYSMYSVGIWHLPGVEMAAKKGD